MSASDWAGFSPRQYTARSSPCSMASNIAVRFLPGRGLDGGSPRLVEPRTGVVVDDGLEARQPVGDGAHVPAALDVVLAAQRAEPTAGPSDVTGEEGQVDERHDVVDAVVMLGDAERPAQLGAVGPAIGMGQGGGYRRRPRR